MLQIAQIDKQFGSTKLFENATLTIKPGERVGLVGPNGTGKTTLLRMLAREESADAGQIIVPKNLTMGYLKQDITEGAKHTVLEEVLQAFPEVANLEADLIKLEKELSERPEDKGLLERYGKMRENFERMDGYTLESRARSILSGVGFKDEQHKLPIRQFSGGWMMRIALARLLMQSPGLLMMDEPTNHLDLESILWLENFLAQYAGTLIIISHDPWFLNRVVSHIAEIFQNQLRYYTGNYDAYLQQREQHRELLEAQFKSQQKKIASSERFIERFRYKASKARQVQSRIKQLEKLDRVELENAENREMNLRLPEPQRSGKIVAELVDVEKRYGDLLVYRDLNLILTRGDKIALVGPNGAGKSTLLKILAAVEPIQNGDMNLGSNVSRFYYAQHQLDDLDSSQTIIEALSSAAPELGEQKLRQIAGLFLFSGDDVFKKIQVLSGGERARVALARMLARPANFLILDEPNNHLDVQSREILQSALHAFKGTLILISHDREFIDAVATSIYDVRDGRIRHYDGNYSYYAWKKQQERQQSQKRNDESAKTASAQKGAAAGRSKKAERQMRARKLQAQQEQLAPLQNKQTELEALAAEREDEKLALQNALCDPAVLNDAQTLAEKGKRLKQVDAELEALYAQWEETAEAIEQTSSRIEAEFADL